MRSIDLSYMKWNNCCICRGNPPVVALLALLAFKGIGLLRQGITAKGRHRGLPLQFYNLLLTSLISSSFLSAAPDSMVSEAI